MFSFFKKDKKIQYLDFVWMGNLQWIEALKKELKAKPETICIVTFFDDTLQQIEKALNESNIKYHTAGSIGEIAGSNEPVLIQANRIISSLSSLSYGTKSNNKKIVFAEHYPLVDLEQKTMERLRKEYDSVQFIFHIHLEQELMKYFGSERIKSLMEKMGANNDAMQHSMISKSIANAQKKLASQVNPRGLNDNTAAGWFKKNT